MSTVFGSKGFLRDTRPVLKQIEPRIFAIGYQSILANVAINDVATSPQELDYASTMRYIDLKMDDVKAVRTLIESNNIKQYTVGVKELTYTPQLFKIMNTVDAIRGQVDISQALQVAVRYLTMQHDAFALFNNHNKCFLEDTQTLPSNTQEDILNLSNLANAYRQFNGEEEPIIMMGFGALSRLSNPIAATGAGGYRYKTALEYLADQFPNAMANYKLVNQYVLDNITEAANKIGSTTYFGTNDVVLYNPNFATLYRGISPNTFTTSTIGDELQTYHFFSTPSLQMISTDRSYRYTFA
ncbi:MAG: hypothetical protein FWE18_00130 [Alphaproteobacteria bacterium]|nr:hypothetical protein [Alphaproteobacteria bacterium]